MAAGDEIEFWALTVQQPWASLMFVKGVLRKNIENRSWIPPVTPPFPLVIHAAARRVPPEVTKEIEEILGVKPLDGDWTYRLLMGIVTVKAVVTPDQLPKSLWRVGPYCWVLEKPMPLIRTREFAGKQKLWRVSIPAKYVPKYYRDLMRKQRR